MIRLPDRGLAVLLFAACVIPFANGLAGDFTYDDKAIVRDNVRIQSPSTLGQIFETSYFGGPSGFGSAYRPILLLSYAVQWWVHGPNAAPFHAVNVLLHAAATLLLWRLLVRLRLGSGLAFGAALLFAIHPVHVEAVSSLVGRGETLAAVFVLGYLGLAVRFAERDGRRAVLLAAALTLYLLALLTKESAAAAPALAFLILAWLARGNALQRAREVLAKGWPLLAGSAAVLAAFFAARFFVLGGWIKGGQAGIFEVENPLAPLPPFARIGNACLLLLRYLGRLFLPLRLSADESAWSIRPEPAMSVAAIGALCLLVLAAVAALRRPEYAASLGLLFFLLAMLPASNVPFPIGTIFAERVAYLPAAGVCVIAAAAIAGVSGRDGAWSRRRLAALGAVALLLSVRTAARVTAWTSDERLFENSVRVAPGSAKNHYNLGWAFSGLTRWREAIAAYEKAVEIYPKYWDAWAGKGKCERELGRFDEARRSYEQALAAQPAYENGYFGLGQVWEAMGDDRRALDVYRRGLEKHPRSLPLSLRVAAVLSQLGDPAAGAAWRRLLAEHPGSLPGRLAFAVWLRGEGSTAASRRELVRILAASPRYEPALREIAAQDASEARAFGAALARERVFRTTRRSGDLLWLLEAARVSPDYRSRFEQVRPRLERLAPWAFRFAEEEGALTPLRPPASNAAAAGG